MPSISRSPESKWSSPPMTLSIVVLPEPEGPRMATNSLSRKDRLTLSSATCVNDCVTYLLQITLRSSMDGNLSRAGALAPSPAVHVRRVCPTLSSFLADTSEECNEPRQKTNGTARRMAHHPAYNIPDATKRLSLCHIPMRATFRARTA